ncbi:MAG TPA: hypothetical protein VH309_11120 [Elusimicrobiota bacterium]|jgi:hypothetical protein|nr:hypothetical protein [Elusimicrobiota bacterium]
MKRKSWTLGACGAAMGALLAAPAAAKVVFTGYGDFQATPQASYRIDGPPSVLNEFGVGPEVIESRGSTINSLGLFATTSLNDQTRLLMDVTYKNIGANVNTISIQYAFVEYADDGATARLGKITLPFNYYNQNRFYPFEHASITAPTFQSLILGLPISDIGATIGRPFDLGRGVTLDADLYGVNGYGPLPGSTSTFRSSGVLSNTLTIANNIGSGSHNHDVAFGGRLELAHADLPDSTLGVSFYHDRWDPAGRNLFQMGGAHLHVVRYGFDFLTEYLLLDVKGDDGSLDNFGSRNWRTDGFFSELDCVKLFVWKKQLTPWIRYEDYETRAQEGDTGKERLTGLAGGASLRLTDGVIAKVEGDDLYYRLPNEGLGDLKIQGYSLALGLTVTF